jgi:hypothetical protein
MILGPFLTDLDSRAAVKGSRDPLGIQSIWTRFGRHVVGNLSTVSNSVRDFTIAILGYHFAEQVAEKVGPGKDLETFLKWEQLAGYARASVNSEKGFRGTERVWRNLEEGVVTLSAETRHQILSSQKLYGLWGLYSVPSRSSGLLDGDPARLTGAAQKLVQELYLSKLTDAGFRDAKRIVELLATDRERLDVKGADRKLLAAVAGIIRWQFTTREREFYREHLLYGGPHDSTEGRQRQLAGLLEAKSSNGGFSWSPPALRGLAKEAESCGDAWRPLAGYLRRIAAAETLLAPASVLFIHLLGCHDTSVSDLAKRVQRAWGTKTTTVAINDIPALQAEMGGGDEVAGQRWLAIAQAMSGGDYGELILLLLAQNRAVMQVRGGAGAWIEAQNGRLQVRMPEERGGLHSKEELGTLWRFPYFLDSLYAVAAALKEDHHG